MNFTECVPHTPFEFDLELTKYNSKALTSTITQSLEIFDVKARFKRRILHVPNLMQMSENNRFFSFAFDSAHVKCDV